MKICFVCTQNNAGSTVIGRVLHIAKRLHENYGHTVTLLLHEPHEIENKNIHTYSVGKNPFSHTDEGKKRLRGFALLFRLKINTLKTLWALQKSRPDVVIIVKTLPQNVLAVWLWSLLHPKTPIVTDIDDFELEANHLTSLLQRFAIHWAERKAAQISNQLIVATPFLADHFEQLTRKQKQISLIPTGINPSIIPTYLPSSPEHSLLYIGSVSQSSGHRVDLLPDILVHVKEKYPNIQLHIVGDGHDMASLKESFRKSGTKENVQWHGRFTLHDISKFLSQTSIIIDPIDDSIANRAKSSFRVALGMITGIPVITSNIGIRGKFIPPLLYDRLCAKPGDIESYARKIEDILKHPLTAEEISTWKQHGQPYHWNTLVQQYNTILLSAHD